MRRPYKEILSEKLDDYDNQPQPYVHPKETLRELQVIQAIDMLVPDDRELIYMRWFDRLSLRQIAALKGYRSHGTAQWRVNRAARQIREHLEKNGDTNSGPLQ